MAREREGARRGVTPGGGCCGCLVWFVPGHARDDDDAQYCILVLLLLYSWGINHADATSFS